jgi:hemolysin activation/secretion protein
MTFRAVQTMLAALTALCFVQTPSLASQTPIDRADPSVVEEALGEDPLPDTRLDETLSIEAERETSSDLSGSIVAGAIRVEGAEALPPSAFAPVISHYVGRSLSRDDLRDVASDIANVARGAGYGLATAWIPPQEVTRGLIRVRLDLGRIDAIEAEGDGATVARRFLAPLANGRPVRTAELERRLLLAGDVAGMWVGDARLERRGDRNILHVETQRYRVRARTYLDNWGSSAVGPVNLSIITDFNGVLAEDDQLTLSGAVTPLQPEEFQLIRAGYSKAVGLDGTMVSLDGYAAWSHPGGVLSDRDIDGTSYQASLGILHPIRRTRDSSLWGELEFTLRDASQTQEGRTARDDRLAKITATAFGIADMGEGRFRGRVALVQGTGAFDAIREGDTNSSRSDGSAIFTKLEYWAEYRRPLGGDFSMQIESEGQVASRPLLSSEEMGLGGRSFVRAFDYREASGDKGIAGSLELRFDLNDLPDPVEATQVYGYVDAGSVGNYRDGGGGDTLASAGGGVRIWLDDVQVGLELGFPLTKSRFSDDKDPRLSFTLRTDF